MTLEADYLCNLRSTADKIPAGTPSCDGTTTSQGLGCVPVAQAGVCPPRQDPLRGQLCLAHPSVLLHVPRHWFGHTKPIIIIILLLHHLCGSQAAAASGRSSTAKKRAPSAAIPNIPAQMGLRRVPAPGQGCDTHMAPPAQTPDKSCHLSLPPSSNAAPLVHWINSARKEQILENLSNSEIKESRVFPVSLQFLPLKQVMLPFCLAQKQKSTTHVSLQSQSTSGCTLSTRGCENQGKNQSCKSNTQNHRAAGG